MKKINKFISNTGKEFDSLEDCLLFEIKELSSVVKDATVFEAKFQEIVENWLRLRGEKIVKEDCIKPNPLFPKTLPDIYPYEKYPKIWYKTDPECTVTDTDSNDIVNP